MRWQRQSRKLLDEHGIKFSLHLQGDFTEVPPSPVVKDAIVENQVHVSLEFELVRIPV